MSILLCASLAALCQRKGDDTLPGLIRQQIDSIYSQCGGDEFFPDSSCVGDSCVPAGLARTVYNEWKRQFKSIHGMSDSLFERRIRIRKVVLVEGPRNVWLRIESVFVLDWVRSGQVFAIHLGKYPLTREPSASDMQRG